MRMKEGNVTSILWWCSIIMGPLLLSTTSSIYGQLNLLISTLIKVHRSQSDNININKLAFKLVTFETENMGTFGLAVCEDLLWR